LTEKLGVEIKGEKTPYFPSDTESKNWSYSSLITSSYGYGLSITPLQLLTFYNGVANKGTILQPLFLEKVEDNGKIIFESEPIVRVEKITSQENLNQMVGMLTEAVETGTARSIYTPNLKMAGKTGTTRVEYWKKNQTQQYQASFCGFFPSDEPMYSCIVVVQKPDRSLGKGFYGGLVAAPVFKEIAGKIFLKLPLNIEKDTLTKKINIEKRIVRKYQNPIHSNTKYLPNLTGLVAKEVIPDLENLGLNVEFKGNGRIVKQSLPVGFRIKKGNTLYLDLE